jgi:hypothetical protein
MYSTLIYLIIKGMQRILSSIPVNGWKIRCRSFPFPKALKSLPDPMRVVLLITSLLKAS